MTISATKTEGQKSSWWSGAWQAFVWLLLPAVLILPSLMSFPYPASGAPYSDLVTSHLPNALFLRNQIQLNGEIPLWSPLILSGYPFFANPLSGLWYPPGWLALLLPLPLGFNLGILLHLAWGGLGMYRLLRLEGLGQPAALLGGLAFQAMPKLIAHYGAGHLTLIYAVVWTPWLLASVRQRAGRHSSWMAGLFAAAILLADVRWAAPALAAWAAFGLFTEWRSKASAQNRSPHPVISWLPGIVAPLLAACLLAAPLLLPLYEYTLLSTRQSLSPDELLNLSLPAVRLLGMLYPDWKGPHEWVLYPGAVIIWLAMLAVLWRRTRRQGLFWIGLAALSLLYALGENIPGFSYLARFPVLNWLRVPPRILFLFGMAISALAATAYQEIWQGILIENQKKTQLALAGSVVFVISLGAGILLIAGTLPAPMVWGTIALAAVGFWMLCAKLLPGSVWRVGILGLCVIELAILGHMLYTPRPARQVMAEADNVSQFLQQEQGRFRVYSPSYSVPQHSAAQAGLHLVDGVDPLQLQDYVNFMVGASGIPEDGYSVTMPPMEDGDPRTANAPYSPNAAQLGLLNARYVVSEFDLINGQRESDFSLIRQFGSTRVYENHQVRDRAWVQLGNSLESAANTVEITDYRPNKIEIRATGPGELVLSELVYPGWQVRVDGERVLIVPYANLLRSVQLPAGPHIIQFKFLPVTLYAGMGLGLLGLAFLAVLIWKAARD